MKEARLAVGVQIVEVLYRRINEDKRILYNSMLFFVRWVNMLQVEEKPVHAGKTCVGGTLRAKVIQGSVESVYIHAPRVNLHPFIHSQDTITTTLGDWFSIPTNV